MTDFANSSQWDRLLQNLGVWQGSFTRLSGSGEILEDMPTVVTLEGIDNHQTVRQTLEYFSATTKELTQRRVLEYSTLNRSILLFEDGAFSQGSLQFSPVAEFGAEFGFICGDRRLRLVQLFCPSDGKSQLSGLTLIRERLAQSTTPDRPPLTLESLLGTWQGHAITQYPDWRPPEVETTSLTLWQQGDRLHQRFTAANFELTSTAAIAPGKLLFDQGAVPIQVLLLPDGASCNTPTVIPRGRSFLLEVGWLLTPTLRQRLMRRYDAQGAWSSLTLVTETKVDSVESPNL